MDNKHGIWYSIIAGDFDQDGDDDYIAGNLGENHRFTVSDQYPLSLYSIDLDLDGVIDPLTTAYWKDKNDKMTEYPINYLDELMGQTTFFQKIFKDYASFSYAGINDMLDRRNIENGWNLNCMLIQLSSYIIWNDRRKIQVGKVTRSNCRFHQ